MLIRAMAVTNCTINVELLRRTDVATLRNWTQDPTDQ